MSRVDIEVTDDMLDMRFRRHTHVNERWCVSTVGDWRFPVSGELREIGAGRFYETAICRLGEDGSHLEWEILSGCNSATDAEVGHEGTVQWLMASSEPTG